MRIFLLFFSLFFLVACQPKNNTPATPPTVDERIGIYQNATVYAASTDYAFEINGKRVFVRVNTLDSLNRPAIPNNLTVRGSEGPPEVNPLLVGHKYVLTFGPQEKLKSIKLLGAHDPSDPELPALPENYSGLLSVGPASDSRAYLHLAADLSATLIVHYEDKSQPIYQHGRWTRTNNGQVVSVQFGTEDWRFLVRDGALILASNQMGTGRLTIMANDNFSICSFIQSWLSDISTIDNQERVKAEDIRNDTPLAEVLRTEHSYMNLYGVLETVYEVPEETIAKALRANPTVQAVCDLVMKVPLEGEG